MSGSTRSTRSSSTVTKLGLLAAFCAVGGVLTASGQNIRSHYVSKAESDGVIYHTFPVTLFESREAGDLTFDITYIITLDEEANDIRGEFRLITKEGSKIPCYIVPTDEELMIARDTYRLIG